MLSAVSTNAMELDAVVTNPGDKPLIFVNGDYSGYSAKWHGRGNGWTLLRGDDPLGKCQNKKELFAAVARLLNAKRYSYLKMSLKERQHEEGVYDLIHDGKETPCHVQVDGEGHNREWLLYCSPMTETEKDDDEDYTYDIEPRAAYSNKRALLKDAARFLNSYLPGMPSWGRGR